MRPHKKINPLFLSAAVVLFSVVSPSCSRRPERPVSSAEEHSDHGGKSSSAERTPDNKNIRTTSTEKPAAAPRETRPANKSSAKITYLQFGSVGCVPCRMMQPTLQYVRENYADRVNVVFHDVWKPDGRAPAAERRIRVIPTQIFLDANGNEFYRNEGFLPKEDVVKIIEARLSE